MSTNHRDKLDPALIRPGRADLHIEYKYASKTQAKELFCRFYPLQEDDDASEKAEEHDAVSLWATTNASLAKLRWQPEVIGELSESWVDGMPEREFSVSALQGKSSAILSRVEVRGSSSEPELNRCSQQAYFSNTRPPRKLPLTLSLLGSRRSAKKRQRRRGRRRRKLQRLEQRQSKRRSRRRKQRRRRIRRKRSPLHLKLLCSPLPRHRSPAKSRRHQEARRLPEILQHDCLSVSHNLQCITYIIHASSTLTHPSSVRIILRK